jgi:hypothetical protein
MTTPDPPRTTTAILDLPRIPMATPGLPWTATLLPFRKMTLLFTRKSITNKEKRSRVAQNKNLKHKIVQLFELNKMPQTACLKKHFGAS